MSGGRLLFKTFSPFINIQREYAMKSPIPIKWNRPEKIPCFKPIKSGDLKPLMQVDPKTIPIEFRESEELKTASDIVKKLFTLEYFPYKKTVEHFRTEYLKETQRHSLDTTSQQARVAKMTADIRDMQKHIELFPKNKRLQVRLKETIDKRKKCLKHLRNADYKCFEWVLEKLGLTYKPAPPKGVYLRVERKRSIRMLTAEHCENLIKDRLKEYQMTLESEQIEFLEHKIKTLEWIMKEESECNIPQTVTLDDIDKTKEKLNNIKASKTKVEAAEDL